MKLQLLLLLLLYLLLMLHLLLLDLLLLWLPIHLLLTNNGSRSAQNRHGHIAELIRHHRRRWRG